MGHQVSYIITTIIIPFIIILFCSITAFTVCHNRSWYFKFNVWGILSLVLISPILSFSISQLVLVISDNAWAGIGYLMLTFGVTEAISVLLILSGVIGYIRTRYKNRPRKSKPQNTDT